MDKNFSYIFIIILLLSITAFSYADEGVHKLELFHSLQCESCRSIINDFMPRIEKRYKDRIKIEYLDIDKIENYKLLLSLEEKYNKTKKDLPIIFIGGRFLSGERQIKKDLERLVQYALLTKIREQGELPSIDLIQRFKSFSTLSVLLAGLVDGVNPCAFTVIVFFITFLAFQRYRRREIVVTGISFIFTIFLTYLLLGIGVFNFLYRLRLFYYVARIFYRSVAALCFILGALAIYDILRFRRTHKGEDMILRLPDKIKYFIQRIIGLYYRQTQKEKPLQRGILSLVLIAIIVGFVVSVLEAVCTGPIYLPTIAFVLKISNLKIQALAYLVLYNLMFIVPLFMVFFLALLGVRSDEFSRFMQSHLVLIKIFIAALFFSLGAILILGL